MSVLNVRPLCNATGARIEKEQREWNNTNIHGEALKRGETKWHEDSVKGLKEKFRGAAFFLTHVNAQCLLSCQSE